MPAVNVTHDDIQKRFLPGLARRLPGFEAARLPTEAEWEHAARAGTSTAYAWGDEPDDQRMNIGLSPGPVQAYDRNPFGLWQMYGNVLEWCADGYGELTTDEAVDPPPPEAARRVLRGGGWFNVAHYCRSALRSHVGPGGRDVNFGFRLALGLPQAQGFAGSARSAEHAAPQAQGLEPQASAPPAASRKSVPRKK